MKTILSLLLSIVFLLLTGFSLFAQQNRWSYVGADVNGTQFFIDRKSIEIKGNKLRIWNKSIFTDSSYRISLVEWACSDQQYYILDETLYSPKGDPVGKDNATKWLFVTPDSISEGLYKATCSLAKTNNTKSANKMKAQVIVKTANVRAEPDINSSVIRKVKSGESFALVDENPTDGWYQIIISGTNKTGWIHGSTIKLVEITDKKKTKKRK